MEIKANAKGTRFIEGTEQHLQTIKNYSLFVNLVGSEGVVDDTTLDKLQRTARALLESTGGNDKDLLDLCFDVIYHRDMKPLGLRNLMLLYISYNDLSALELELEGFAAQDMIVEGDTNDE